MDWSAPHPCNRLVFSTHCRTFINHSRMIKKMSCTQPTTGSERMWHESPVYREQNRSKWNQFYVSFKIGFSLQLLLHKMREKKSYFYTYFQIHFCIWFTCIVFFSIFIDRLFASDTLYNWLFKISSIQLIVISNFVH